MECNAVRGMLDRYVDGELDAGQAVALEAHVRGCGECRALLEQRKSLSEAIRERAAYHPAPDGLAARIRARAGMNLTEARATTERAPAARAPLALRTWQPLAMAASLLLAVAVSSGTTYLAMRPAAEPGTVDEVVADHIRSLQAKHLTDVASTDQHTVKPWFDGRIDLAPTVKDLSAKGFPLIGGRLDYLGGAEAAALVYGHSQHVINVFVTKGGANAAPSLTDRKGYNVLHWVDGGMSYWAVSDVTIDVLEKLQRLIAAPD
ncbi:MAG TPA: anti-sigma factor [Candidatus Cybelea sp.]|nr:anti-sigma factor [Candidatus Cybelea sp.]